MRLLDKQIKGAPVKLWAVLVALVLFVLILVAGPALIVMTGLGDHCFSNCRAPAEHSADGGGGGGG
ncbi:hypothetical protein EYS09_04790 [Streptomyces kasugaensis]|uniref:Uncharacterized protein n=1 Tax=Streptomyces kasugaensis TaxID=1946 RepID=A0A4Q9HZM1_STRKA|nr:hypothetical protein [Streptomyces kasugaensis]TBO60756.1 hypothetical protein EYS09_04790 [Streptomyces kasugaensis]